MNYKVELTDDDGKSCKVRLSIPWDTAATDTTNSTWSILEEGFVKFRSGGCSAVGGFATPLTLRLKRGNEYGIELFQFTDRLRLVNSSGEGKIYQPWCLSFKPEHITWALIE